MSATQVEAATILQKVVRGHLTRNKLREAKELYESIFNELEEDGDNFEIHWQYSGNTCWPSASLALKPNQTNNAVYPTAEQVVLESENKLIEESLVGVESLLDEIMQLSNSTNHKPKPSTSQPSLSVSQRRSKMSASVSNPGLEFSPPLERKASVHRRPSSCKLCQKITDDFGDGREEVVAQTVRSKSKNSRVWLPSGTPATAVDGTMYRRKSCYKVSLPDNLAGSRGVRETTRSYANVQRARSKSSCDHHRTSTIDRCFERHGRESWPKSGILPSTCASSPQTTPSSTPTHSPRGRRRVRRPAVTQSISVSEIAAQTEANVAVDVSVQTVTHVAIQTEDRVETPAPTVTTPCSPSSLLSLSDACIQEQLKAASTSDTPLDVPPADTPLDVPPTDTPLDVAPADTPLDALDLTNVSSLPERDGETSHSQTFHPTHSDSSTPLRHPQTTPQREETVQQQTSLWPGSRPASQMKSKYEVSEHATPEELNSIRENVSMELMWIEQAIASRKQYLSLVKSMKEAPTKL